MTDDMEPDASSSSPCPHAGLLGELDAFLRSGGTVVEVLTEFMRERGHQHPGLAACSLVDELSFIVYRTSQATLSAPRVEP